MRIHAKAKKQDLIYPALTVGIAAADQMLKAAARKKLSEGESTPLQEICPVHRRHDIPENISRRNVIYIYNSRNRGAAMNLLEEHPAFVSGVSAGMTAALTGLLALDLLRPGHKVQKTGLALLLGGAYSNTIDRVKDQAVTDYINFRVGPSCLKNTVFNLGDFAIAIGAALAAGGSAE